MQLVARNQQRRWRVLPAAAREGADAASAAPLLAVLWRRRSALVVTTVVCLLLAALYLKLATPVYRAAATVHVVQPGETVWDVARTITPSGDVRATVDRIIERNGGALLRPGQRLVLD